MEQALFLKGEVTAPASKSYTLRAILAAALNGKTRIYNPLLSEDTQASEIVLGKLGALIERGKGWLDIQGFKGRPVLKTGSLNVGESGTLLRLILPLIVLCPGKLTVNGRGTLLKRTNQPIVEALLALGVRVRGRDKDYKLPLTVYGKGEIPGGKVKVRGSLSSQTISALLMAAPLAKSAVEIIVMDKVVSRPYIDITLDVLKRAGIKVRREGYQRFFIKPGQRFEFKRNFRVGGDYSSAAFLIAAGCLVKSDIVITNLLRDMQGDRMIIPILNSMGARIRQKANQITIKGPFELKGRELDCSDTPDLVPILTVLACFAQGKTRIYNIGHLMHKESNRITAPAGELKKLGARIKIGADSLIIQGSILRSGRVSSCNDHRIAMSLAVAGLKIGRVVIEKAQAINKSYPDFIRDIRSLGGKIKIIA